MNPRKNCGPKEAAGSGEPVPDFGEGEVVAGFNGVLAALKNRPRRLRSILVAEGRHPGGKLREIFDLAHSLGLKVKFQPRQALDRLYPGQHQGVLALGDEYQYADFEEILARVKEPGPALILALDRVEDPGNLGALMRSASAFGAAGILIPRERAAVMTPAAIRAAAGAAEFMPLARVVNLRRALEELRDHGFWLAGMDGEGEESLFSFNFPDRCVILLGSEGRGLSPGIRKICDHLVAIPQRREAVSSLNVSVAGGIVLSRYFQQVPAPPAPGG